MILYSGDNAANTSDPGDGTPWEQVGNISNGNPQSNSSGSVVHLRGKYILTADHVEVKSRVTFDGVTFYDVDPHFDKIQIGAVDMVILKLRQDPGLDDIVLNTSTSEVPFGIGPFRTEHPTVMVGYGRGRSSSQEDAGDPVVWTWGGNATVAKRWGTNEITSAIDFTDGESHAYDGLRIRANSGEGNSEAALAYFDSGSALFQEIDGQWVLSGMATLVQTAGSSTFSNSGDYNYYVRISSYADDILAALPNLSTYAGWVTDNSLQAYGDDPSGDPDHDGMSNFLEYAYGTNPLVADAHLGLRVTCDESDIILSWQQSTTAAGLSFFVQRSDDQLATPFEGVAFSASQTGTGEGITTWEVAAPISGPASMLRLEVVSSE